MKLATWTLASALAVFAGAAPAWSGNVNGSFGSRMLDNESDWAPLDEQPTFGVIADFQLAALPLYATVGLQASADDDEDGFSEVTVGIADLSLGLKLMPAQGVFRPYVNAGFVSVGASVEIDDGPFGDEDDDDQSFGYFFGGGVLLRIGEHFNLGADARWIRGTELELLGAETDADSFVVTALAGFGWGS